jgi:hypothetical protein
MKEVDFIWSISINSLYNWDGSLLAVTLYVRVTSQEGLEVSRTPSYPNQRADLVFF